MKKLNERFGAKLDENNLLLGRGELKNSGRLTVENKKLPYYVLQDDKNCCKFVTFCDKIGDTMRGISQEFRGVMSDIRKGKSEENGKFVTDLCEGDVNQKFKRKNKNKNLESGKIEGVKGVTEACFSDKIEAVEGVTETQNCGNVKIDEDKNICVSEAKLCGELSEDEGKVNVSNFGRAKCVSLSREELQNIRKIAKRRVAEMQRMEKDVHPVFMPGAVSKLSDRDKFVRECEYKDFGLRKVAEIDVDNGESDKNEGEQNDVAERNIGNIENFENASGCFKLKQNIESGNNVDNVGSESKNYNENLESGGKDFGYSDTFKDTYKNVGGASSDYESDYGYSGSALKGLDGYEQVSKCILCSPNSSYGEESESYETIDRVNYGRLVFDDSNNGSSDRDETCENLKANFESETKKIEKQKRKKGKAKAYIVGAGDENDCFPVGKMNEVERQMYLDASIIGLDEEFIPMEVKNCELLNMRLDKRDVKFWGEKQWIKFFIKVDPCLAMCIDYCDRLVEKMVVLGGYPTESMAYGSAENMFNEMIDLIERKKMYLRLKKFVDRLKRELDVVDEKIIAYFVFGENTKDELLQIMSRRTVYRRASRIIKKLADFCIARGYTAKWLYEKFGSVV